MPAPVEVGVRPQPHVRNTFERLSQGGEARRLQVEAFHQAQLDFAQDGLVLVGSPTSSLASEPSHHRLPMEVVNVAAALGLLAAACGVQPRTSPPSEPPRSAEVRPTDPGATATAAAEIEKGRVNIPIIGKGVPAAPTPEPTPIPAQSPVEQAIEKGKIEIKEPAELADYFKFVSPSVAREKLAMAREKGGFRFIIPGFYVLGAGRGNFEIINHEVPLDAEGKKKMVYLLMKGIPLEAIHSSPFDDAEAFPNAVGISGSNPIRLGISYRNRAGDLVADLVVPRKGGTDILRDEGVLLGSEGARFRSRDDPNGWYPVQLGTPIFRLQSDTLWPGADAQKFPGSWQASFYIRIGKGKENWDYTGASLRNALVEDGKFLAVSPQIK